MIEFGCHVKPVDIGAIKGFCTVTFGELRLEGFTVVESEEGFHIEFTKPRVSFESMEAKQEFSALLLAGFKKVSDRWAKKEEEIEGQIPVFRGRCLNCGDKTSMPSTAVAERARRGWCTGCYNQFKKCKRTHKKGGHQVEEHWEDRFEGRNYFASRPGHPADDSV